MEEELCGEISFSRPEPMPMSAAMDFTPSFHNLAGPTMMEESAKLFKFAGDVDVQTEATETQPVSSITFDWLIKQQKISGEFKLDINASIFDEYNPAKALQALQEIQGLKNVQRVCATLLGIVIFMSKFQGQEGQWILMRAKSEKFLKKQMKDV